MLAGMPQAKSKEKESYSFGSLIADLPAPEHEAAESAAYEKAEAAEQECHDESRVGGSGGTEQSLSDEFGSPEAFAGGGPAGYGDESLESAVRAPVRSQAGELAPAPTKARQLIQKVLKGVQGLQPGFVSQGGQTSLRGQLDRLKPTRGSRSSSGSGTPGSKKSGKSGKPSKSGKSGY